jgi:hypothetical protein
MKAQLLQARNFIPLALVFFPYLFYKNQKYKFLSCHTGDFRLNLERIDRK